MTERSKVVEMARNMQGAVTNICFQQIVYFLNISTLDEWKRAIEEIRPIEVHKSGMHEASDEILLLDEWFRSN